MSRGRIRNYLGRNRRAIIVSLVLAIIFLGIAYYNNAPYADACNGHFTDRGLDQYFAHSGDDGLSWDSAYVFEEKDYIQPTQQFALVFDHTTRYVILRGCEFFNSSSADGVQGGAIKFTHARNFKIQNCLFEGGDAGIYIEHSQDFEIMGSSFRSLVGTGLQLNYVHQALVKDNIFLDDGLGIGISEGSHHTTLTLNNFSLNLLHANDASLNSCTWFSNGLGNYWGDYLIRYPDAAVTHDNAILDSLADGVTGAVFIGLIPYAIATGTKDCFPLIYLANQMPIITVVDPINESIWGIESPDFDVSISGHLVMKAWYSFDGVTNFTIGVPSDFPFIGTKTFTGTIDQAYWDTLPSGGIHIAFHAKTWFGVEGVQEVGLDKDTVAPVILIDDPIADRVFGNNPPSFSLVIAEEHLTELWYTCNNADVLVPITELSGTISSFMWGACGDGYVFIHFFARDINGNTGSATVRVMKDTVPPSILIVSPSPEAIYGNNSVSFQFESHDLQLILTWVAIGGDHVVEFGNGGTYSGIIPSDVWRSCLDGPVEICFGAVDSLGNVQEQSVIVIKDSEPPVVNFGFLHSDIAGSTPPEILWAFDDASSIVVAWYVFDGSTVQYALPIDMFAIVIDAIGWGLQADGAVSINLFVQDRCGNIGSCSNTIIKDTTAPSLVIKEPGYLDTFGRKAPDFSIEVSDLSLKSIRYYLNDSGMSCQISIGSGQNGKFIGAFDSNWWNLLADGVLNITFEVVDDLGHSVSSYIIIKKDACPPALAIIHPTLNSVVSSIPPTFEVIASDPSYVHRVWYSLDRGQTLVFLPLNTFTGSFDSTQWGSLFMPGQNLTIMFWANDTLGNIVSTSIVVKCEEEPTWNLFHGHGLFATLLVTTVVLLAVILVLEIKHHPKGGKRLG